MLDVQGSPELSKGPDKQPSDSDPWIFASNWILKVPLQYCNPSIMSRNLAFYCDDFSNIYFRLDIWFYVLGTVRKIEQHVNRKLAYQQIIGRMTITCMIANNLKQEIITCNTDDDGVEDDDDGKDDKEPVEASS